MIVKNENILFKRNFCFKLNINDDVRIKGKNIITSTLVKKASQKNIWAKIKLKRLFSSLQKKQKLIIRSPSWKNAIEPFEFCPINKDVDIKISNILRLLFRTVLKIKRKIGIKNISKLIISE